MEEDRGLKGRGRLCRNVDGDAHVTVKHLLVNGWRCIRMGSASSSRKQGRRRVLINGVVLSGHLLHRDVSFVEITRVDGCLRMLG